MRGLVLGIFMLATAALSAAAQMGRQIAVQEGSPEDKAITAIQSTNNLHQKLVLLNQFAAAHPSGDMALMADSLYVNVYSSLKDYSKAYAYGDKALALDPDNLNVAVQLIRDAQLQGDTARMVSYAVRVGQMVAAYKSQPPPAGMSADQWAQQKRQTLSEAQPQINWVIQTVDYAVSAEQSSSAKTAMQSQLAKAFPEGHAAR